jgi:hypothetical protein
MTSSERKSEEDVKLPVYEPVMVRGGIFSIKGAEFSDVFKYNYCSICEEKGHVVIMAPVRWYADASAYDDHDYLTPDEYQGEWHRKLWAS